MTSRDRPIAQTSNGNLQGAWNDAIAVFRGVPYAAPPVGELRFTPPRPFPAWTGIREALDNGPIAPQLPSRLSAILGDISGEQGEDCLSLTIWTPAADGARRPVMVALHGGAWVSGAGSLDWYDGGRLAREGDIVVVGVNSRLGALGYLHCPGVSKGNLGLLDQEAALAWVRDNIAGFGGNPDDVTLMGQSAGAFAVTSMLSRPHARGLFKRAIVQSAAFRKEINTPDAAAAMGRMFVELLGLDPQERELGQKLRGIPVDRILAAQGELGRKTARFANIVGPFRPVEDSASAADFDAGKLEGAVDRDILIGTTREETAAFYMIDPKIRALEPAAAAEIVAVQTGDPTAWERYRHLRPGGTPADVLCDATSDSNFRLGSLRFAAEAAARGARMYVYQFDWAPPASPVKACHCIELPFVFGTLLDRWRDAPMLAGADTAKANALSAIIRRSWIAFIRTGNPNHGDIPTWPVYEAQRRMTMRFDTVVGAVGDLGGYSSRSLA